MFLRKIVLKYYLWKKCNMFECKYCGVSEKVEINEKEVVCKNCGLVYLVHKSLKNDKIKYLSEEWV